MTKTKWLCNCEQCRIGRKQQRTAFDSMIKQASTSYLVKRIRTPDTEDSHMTPYGRRKITAELKKRKVRSIA